jgi:riboflavin synthase
MFSGIVSHVSKIIDVQYREDGRVTAFSITEEKNKGFNQLTPGVSIAINGVCLTVATIRAQRISFDILENTLTLSNLDSVQIGTLVNVEYPIKLTDFMSGSIVRGVVDTVAFLRKNEENFMSVHLRDKEGYRYVSKGNTLTLNGVNLTIVALEDDEVKFELTPSTLKYTNLYTQKVGSKLNVEYDLLERTLTDKMIQLLKWR